MKCGLITSTLLHSIFFAFFAIASISGNPAQMQQNKSEKLIVVSILENLDNRDSREEVKKVNQTQGLRETEAAKETSVPLQSTQVLTEISTAASQTLTCAVEETSTVRTLVQDTPCAGVQDFQPLQPMINKDNLLQEYISQVKAEIERKKNYPQIARRKGIEGVVKVQFCVSNDGRLKTVTIAASSGCKILDAEAVMSVRKASPFLCIPEELKKEELDMKIGIAFKLL